MTLLTDRFDLPYPEDPDDPNGPLQIEALANATEDRLAFAGAQGGKSIIAAEQAIPSNIAYALAGTPDRVQGLVVPNDGDLIVVRFSGLVKRGGGGQQVKAAIFLKTGGVDTQLKAITAAGAPAVQEVLIDATTDPANYRWVYTSQTAGGLAALHNEGTAADASDVATGLAGPGGFIPVERLAAGTYDVSVQFVGAATGSIKRRRLEAYTREYPAAGV